MNVSKDEIRPLSHEHTRMIADAFLPDRRLGNRYDYYYTRSKLRRDPLYPGVVAALRGTTAPVLDLGCGLGLLAHVLRQDGQAMPYIGVDNDAGKIARAKRAAARSGLSNANFEVVDLAHGLPGHRGSVTLLDVLQFVPPQAQAGIVDGAIAMLTPGARLVIRTGLDDGSARAWVTRFVDVLSRYVGWMNTGPKRYPIREALRARFEAAGLVAEFLPLRSYRALNNWMVVATR